MSWVQVLLIAACLGACANLCVLRRLSGCARDLWLARTKLARLQRRLGAIDAATNFTGGAR